MRPADDQALLRAASEELDAVEAVLARLDDGSFDRCETCGGPIGTERLVADPLERRCGEHASERPVAVLAGDEPLPFGGQQPQG